MPSKSFWIIAILATLWNAIGAYQYIAQVTLAPQDMQAMPTDMQAYFNELPNWVTGAFAIAVWSGLAGSVGLLLRAKWAFWAFCLSLTGVLVQLIYNVLMQTAMALSPQLLAGPLFILVIAVALTLVSKKWMKVGLLH